LRFHSICARLQYGDAVTNQVLSIHDRLRSWGWESHVYATDNDERMQDLNEGLGTYKKKYSGDRDDVLIYHYSIYDENHREYKASGNRKIFIYHNITPPEFFAPYDPFLTEACRKGRELLPQLAQCDLALGDSEFNRRELVEAGFAEEKTGVLPIFVDFEGMEDRYNVDLYDRLVADGMVNLLFVGRLVPNKRVEDLLDIFAVYHRRVNACSRLFLVGTTWSMAYNIELATRIKRYGLEGSVFIPGLSWGVSDEDLRAYYRAAHLFITCSLHEGFCVPLLESMHFRLPILARESSAIPYTLGGAGMTFRELQLFTLAEAIREMVGNLELREALAEKGARRLEDFAPHRTAQTLRDLMGSVLTGSP
jgi:glycosyltransferase involved in cell wall biosynthesis